MDSLQGVDPDSLSSVVTELWLGAVDLLVTVGHHLLEALHIMFDNFIVY